MKINLKKRLGDYGLQTNPSDRLVARKGIIPTGDHEIEILVRKNGLVIAQFDEDDAYHAVDETLLMAVDKEKTSAESKKILIKALVASQMFQLKKEFREQINNVRDTVNSLIDEIL